MSDELPWLWVQGGAERVPGLPEAAVSPACPSLAPGAGLGMAVTLTGSAVLVTAGVPFRLLSQPMALVGHDGWSLCHLRPPHCGLAEAPAGATAA